MPKVMFTPNLNRHVECPDCVVAGETVRDALNAVFEDHLQLRGYILDEHGRLRVHMVIFVDGQPLKDKEELSDPVNHSSEIYVMQALSGGSQNLMGRP